MIILALDQSVSRTGWCLYEPPSHRSMRIGSFTSRPKTGMSTEEKAAVFCDEIEKLFKELKPRFVVWEAATELIRAYPRESKADLAGQKPPSLTVNADQLILRDIQGHIRHAARARRIPYFAVNPKTWHAAMLKNGNISREDAKAKARALCATLKIPVKNEDQAEAVCIALWAETSQHYRMMKATAA